MLQRLAPLAPLALLVGCTTAHTPPEGDPPGSDPTFYADVKPLLQRHCVSCHQPGQIGVGDLTDPDVVVSRAALIKQQVSDRIMPPWLADGDCRDYAQDASLSDAEIETFARWADTGAALGDPADDAGVAPHAPAELPRIDHRMQLPEPYSPKTGVDDDYRCFILDWPETAVSYVTGFGVRPGNATTVHHVIAYVAAPNAVDQFVALDDAEEGPGYTCYGGPGGQVGGATFFGTWAPGTQDLDFSTYGGNSGVRMEPGSKVIVQMHYNTLPWDGEPDQTEIVVKVDDQVDVEGKFAFVTNPVWVINDSAMAIPAGDPAVQHEAMVSPSIVDGGGFTLRGVGAHMHTRGTSLRMDRVDGDDTCLLDVPRWDFNWQLGYVLEEPVSFTGNEQIRIGCTWDNSPENQPSVDGMKMPPQMLGWGDGTNDEMCLGIFYVTVD